MTAGIISVVISIEVATSALATSVWSFDVISYSSRTDRAQTFWSMLITMKRNSCSGPMQLAAAR